MATKIKQSQNVLASSERHGNEYRLSSVIKAEGTDYSWTEYYLEYRNPKYVALSDWSPLDLSHLSSHDLLTICGQMIASIVHPHG